MKTQLGRGAAETQKRLNQISQRAAKLAELLTLPDHDLDVILSLVRLQAIDPEAGRLFDLQTLSAELHSIAASASVCSKEIPRMGRGQSLKVIQARLMEAATAAIGEAFRDIEIEVKQADSEGRNPRAASSTGELLFQYLALVEPKMTDKTKVRLFLDFNRAWRSVTLREIENDLLPRKFWRQAVREELIAAEFDLPSKSRD